MNINQSFSKLLEEARKIQEKMQETQQQLSDIVVEGKSGGDLVVIKMDGNHEVRNGWVKIDSTLIDNINMLEDLIAAAINDAKRKIEKISKEKMNKLSTGFEIPIDLMKNS
ncbi:YbaB/EbfC family nucleoid-associated protein [Candidatus Legionella polyplacis]|uniref:YbaB/EbfC family nucleoid-associated protein n=1 Tax=Candidatus Legionella polyplacis TaxID=2005262 RepID=UPI000C1E6736|nr:YbaB/EbfC family nucleoid-associated protein [Candidatus Legionella polyplacis]ATW01904.1 YbaB/EbfC family nucleoid-associated protein [Candidatus Legionella polyplacis]